MTTNRSLRIDAVLATYPVTTQTFHYRRLAAMAEMGVLGTVWCGKRGEGSVSESLSMVIEPHIRYLSELPRPSARIVAQFRCLLVEAGTLPTANNGEGGRLGAVHHTMLGLRLGQHLASAERPDWLHAMFSTVELTMARSASRVSSVPLSVEVHSPTSMQHNRDWLRTKLNDVQSIAAISTYCANSVRSLEPSLTDHTIVVRCGLESDRAEKPMSGGYAVSVGSLIPKKGHDVFVEACARAGVAGKIVGGGPLEADLLKLVEDLDADVEVLGELDHASTLEVMASATVGVMASRRAPKGDEDGLPVALLELMSRGIPVCATTVAAIPEIVRGRGTLVVADDPIAMAAALEAAMTSSHERLDAGRDAVRRMYDVGLEAHRLVNALAAMSDST